MYENENLLRGNIVKKLLCCVVGEFNKENLVLSSELMM